MMHAIQFAGKMLRRDWRSGELSFLLFSLIIAVSALTAIGFFTDRMRASLEEQALEMLGADWIISAPQRISPTWVKEAQEKGLITASTIVFPTMASKVFHINASKNEGSHESILSTLPEPKLVTLKAVTSGYPLRGQFKLYETEVDYRKNEKVVAKQIPDTGQVWVEPSLLQQLDMKIGDAVQIGEANFQISYLIAHEPDKENGFLALSSKIIMNEADLEKTQLLQQGSRATYRLLLSGEKSINLAFQAEIHRRIKVENRLGYKIENIESNSQEIKTTLARAEQFLAVVSSLSSMLAALAIAMAAHRFMQRHRDACAMLKCLGLTQRQIVFTYLFEFLMVGLLASLMGVAMGWGAHYFLIDILGDLITVTLPSPSWKPVFQGVLLGLWLLVSFAMPSIWQLKNVPHNHVIRREVKPLSFYTLLNYVLGLLGFLVLLMWQTQDIKIGSMVAAGFLMGMLVFALIARLSTYCLRLMKTWSSFHAWRFAIQSLQRRPNVTVLQVISLSVGLMALLILMVVRTELVGTWKSSIPSDAPNYFVLNILPDQKEDVGKQLQSISQTTKPELFPIIRGRLVQIRDEVVDIEKLKDNPSVRSIDRDLNISTTLQMPSGNVITQGQWMSENSEVNAASIEETLAKNLKIQLGDSLIFDMAGEKILVKVTSLRKVDWGSMRANFFVLIHPKALENQSRTYVTAFYFPDRDRDVITKLNHQYPNLTMIDMGAIVRQLQSILEQVILAVEFLFMFTLASGLLVLYATLMGTQDVRMREAAILRALGATQKQLSHAQWLEFILLGALSGSLAALAAIFVGWTLSTQIFKLDWHFSWWILAVGVMVGILCSFLGGYLGLRRVLTQAPLAYLRG